VARPSPLALVVLSLLAEEPMHAYRMQRMLTERRKDQVANIAQRNSVYQTIAALQRAGLITVRETARDARRPERTVYDITEKGRRTLQEWMRTVLSTPARDFPDFPAALSLAAGLAPGEVRKLLEARIRALETRLVALETPIPNLPRLFLLESEYSAALVRAEIAWLRGIAADLRSKRLTWSESWLRRIAAELAGKPAPQENHRAPRTRRRPQRRS
jgi:DNA-binding PadR family transcriptional regulator